MSDRWEDVSDAVELLTEGEVDAAVQALRAIAMRDPTNADAHYWLGRALVRRQEMGPAMMALQMAVKQAPDFLGAWVELGLCQRELGQLDAAIRSAATALGLRADDSDALHLLGVAHAERGGEGDLALAVQYLARFLAQRGIAAEARLDAEVLHQAISRRLAGPPN